jgi:hypothetical protein
MWQPTSWCGLRLNGIIGWQDALDLPKTAIVLLDNTHNKAQGEPLPSLVDFGAEVATILCIRQSLVLFTVVTPKPT